MKKEKDEKLEQIKGILFSVYFITSCVLMFIIHNMMPFLFGQLFFVAAMIFLSETDKSNLPVLCHLTIGLFFMYMQPFNKIPKTVFSDLSTKNYINIILFVLSIILGYVFIIVHKYVSNRKTQLILYIGSWMAFIISFASLLYFSWPYLF